MINYQNINISIIIPAYNAENYILKLIERIESQTLLPNEIIIVDSSSSNNIRVLIENRKNKLNIIVKNIKFSYPGSARNIGVSYSKNDWIAFLDCRTIPEIDWLESIVKNIRKNETQFIGACRLCSADTEFKKILRAVSYGRIPAKSLAGSLISKNLFSQIGGFNPSVRAGEDLEWFDRFKVNGINLEWDCNPHLIYEGLPESLFYTIQKWYIYNISNSQIIIRIYQKFAYLLIFVVLILLLSWNWNNIVTDWDETNILFLPNITKIILSFLILVYILVRGIILPMRIKEPLDFILPYRFIQISYVGLCIDLAKAPGMIVGAIKLLFKLIKN